MNSLAWIALATACLLAGCAGTTEPAGVATPASLPTEARAGPDAVAAENVSTAAALALYLHPDGTIALAPAAAAGEVALGVPVNGPVWDDGDYPSWRGTFGEDLAWSGQLQARLFATTTSAAVAGNNAPVFADSPAVILQLAVGDEIWDIDLSGPATLQAGQVAEFAGSVVFDEPLVIPAGQEVEVTTIVIYSHVAAAAEFRIVMGPDHPTGLAP